MISTPLNQTHHFPTSIFHPNRRKTTQMSLRNTNKITRRKASSSSIILTSLTLFSSPPISTKSQTANAVENNVLDMFRMTVPDQTVEEAEKGIREHAQSLLKVKDLLELESWKEAQKALRKSSSYLKQDIYTLIQAKPGMERGKLRKLYSDVFNSVSGLDYAARDKDVVRVWVCYGNIVAALNDILSRLL